MPGIFGNMNTGQLLERRPQHLHQRRVGQRHRMQAALGVVRHGHKLAAQGLWQALEQQRHLLTQQPRDQAVDQAWRELSKHGHRDLHRHAVVRLARREVVRKR